jgi:hypothetical protein
MMCISTVTNSNHDGCSSRNGSLRLSTYRRKNGGAGAIAKWLRRQIRTTPLAKRDHLFLFEGAGSNPAGVVENAIALFFIYFLFQATVGPPFLCKAWPYENNPTSRFALRDAGPERGSIIVIRISNRSGVRDAFLLTPEPSSTLRGLRGSCS